MFRVKHLKIIISTFLLLIAVWFAVPTSYTQQLFRNDLKQVTPLNTEAKIESKSSTDDADLEKYNKPVYFNIFKFLFSFIPVKSGE